MNRGNVLLRVDGTAKLGMGSLARCLALANALQRRRYQMIFVSHIDNIGWAERIRRFRHTVAKFNAPLGGEADRANLLAEIERRDPVMVVTDTSHFDEEFLAQIANRVPLLISLDDHASIRFPSDLIINPFLGRTESDYQVYPGSQLAVGQRYAMIRAEFRRARTLRAMEPGGPFRVLVALGGGDVTADTLQCLRALLKSKRVDKIDAVVGPTARTNKELAQLTAGNPERISTTYDARDMGMRMTKAHLLITGGGNTALEAACVGIPMLLIPRDARQARNAQWLEELGVAHCLGSAGKVALSKVLAVADMVLEDNFERKTMSRSGRKLIDGRGPDRIVTATEVLLCRARQNKVRLAA